MTKEMTRAKVEGPNRRPDLAPPLLVVMMYMVSPRASDRPSTQLYVVKVAFPRVQFDSSWAYAMLKMDQIVSS